MLEIGGHPALDISDIAITGSPWNFLGVSVASEVILDRKKHLFSSSYSGPGGAYLTEVELTAVVSLK